MDAYLAEFTKRFSERADFDLDAPGLSRLEALERLRRLSTVAPSAAPRRVRDRLDGAIRDARRDLAARIEP